MVTIKRFTHNGAMMALRHNRLDDSRHVVDLMKPSVQLLTFDSSTRIFNADKKQVGYLRSTVDSWALVIGEQRHVLGPHRDYHWDALADCEVEAARILLKSYNVPVDQTCG